MDNLNLEYVYDKKFENMSNKRNLRFDFFIEDNKIAIEYDGIQHYEPRFGDDGTEFKKTKKRDNIKNKYCEENGIDLLRIPYYEKNIEDKIKKFLHEII